MTSRYTKPGRLLLAVVTLAGLTFVARPAEAQESLFFEVTPRRICQGETVEVRWSEAEDRGVLVSEPHIDGTGEVEEEGTLEPSLRDSTLFRMFAISDGDTTRAIHEVAVFRDGQEKTLAFSLHVEGDTTLVAETALRADVWSSKVLIRTLSTSHERPINVVHRGKETELNADHRSVDDFRGLPMRGDWKVQTPVLPDEELGHPEKAPPPRLYLTVTVLCSE